MSQTPNHGYNVPNKGDPNWHKPLNDNFRQYDRDIEVRDTDANTGNYQPKQGAKFLAVDTGVVYEGDGSNWQPSLALSRFSEASLNGAAGNVVAGLPKNSVGNGVSGATIAGGGFDDGNLSLPNTVTADFGTVGGGSGNTVGGISATVGGGTGNEASADRAVVAGGRENKASGTNSAVTGGMVNEALADRTAIGGGFDNEASDRGATVSGGSKNRASKNHATVGGGETNAATGINATVGGGRLNGADGKNTTVAGGNRNKAYANYATIAGGGPTSPGSNPSATRNEVHDDYGTIGGGGGNVAGRKGNSAHPYATVSGGKDNKATAGRATVGGGRTNVAAAEQATVAGGEGNEATGVNSTVGGGFDNEASANQATVAGGATCEATDGWATVCGGSANTASGEGATIPGGFGNTASGESSFAAGRQATADGKGTFVWGDSSSQGVTATKNDEFKVQAGGGAVIFSASDLSAGVTLASGSGSWSAWSTRKAKTDIDPVDPAAALEGVRNLDVATWTYESQDDSVRHMGPMAEDFYDEFGLGDDRERIANVDADGVALAAIQGLAERIEAKDDRIAELEAENEELHDRLATLEERVEAMDDSAGSTND